MRDPLRVRQDERASMLERVRRIIEADSRISAAWLEGSSARGATDALSDLDLAVVVDDAAMRAVADGPVRPVDYGHVLDSARARWISRVAEPLLLLEAPQNAPVGGAFLTSFFAGEYGPQQVDWLWLPLSTARRPRESLPLFDRVGVPAETESSETEIGQPGPAPDRTPFEVSAHAVPWFWATLLWNAKHIARTPNDITVPMLGSTVRAMRDVHLFVEPTADAATREPVLARPTDRLAVLNDLTDRMERLLPRASRLCVGMPADITPQVRRYLRLVEQIGRTA